MDYFWTNSSLLFLKNRVNWLLGSRIYQSPRWPRLLSLSEFWVKSSNDIADVIVQDTPLYYHRCLSVKQEFQI